MSILDLFWIFIVISSLLPVIQKRMLEAARLRLMRELEKRRNSRVIALIHRQETMALLGFPIYRYIDIEDSEEVLRAIKLTDDNLPSAWPTPPVGAVHPRALPSQRREEGSQQPMIK